MNWTSFQTYNDAPTRAFEILCNQLFENWCKEEYKSELRSFHVVNGAGGDGGVESYAALSDNKIVGLQAKWFPNSITANQITQIKNSIQTALRVRPKITRYIVCVPRDLASLTGKGENTEDERWNDMKLEMLKTYPDLTLELWDETRLTQELQKDCSKGIFKFWFKKAEISEENIKFSFEKSKNSWLLTKYAPELNTYGTIHSNISNYLGDIEQRKKQNEFLDRINNGCNKFYTTSDELIGACGDNDPKLVTLLNETKTQIQTMQSEVKKIQSWLKDESILAVDFDEKAFWVDFNDIAAQIEESKEKHSYYFHFSAVIEALKSLSKTPIYSILNQIKSANDRRSLVFLGEPGTGKTHGIAAETEKLLSDGYHVPILIQARDISVTATWKDILISSLGLADSWSEEEIWQGLSSLANRKKIQTLGSSDHVTVLPKIIIVVDGVDESSPHDKWIQRVQETIAIVQKYPYIRFCFMSRPYVFKDKDNVGKIVNIGVNGDVPTSELFDSYVKAYQIDVSSAGWIKYALTTPLALKFFCELNKGKKIHYDSETDVSIEALLKEKIKILENEYCKQDTSAEVNDHNILGTISILADLFNRESRIERNQIINLIVQELHIDIDRAKKLIRYLENYGILYQCCEHGSGWLSPDVYFYYPGIQGYFDYASALILIKNYGNPQNIDFQKYGKLPTNAYYILAIISIQKFNYLITKNKSINSVIDKWFKEELSFFALRHTNPSKAGQYKSKLLHLMAKNAETLKSITNNIVLPLARELRHPLGVTLLNDFLLGFDHPAQRDLLWSVPCRLKESKGEAWYSSAEIALAQSPYFLTDVDTADGLPTVYAWALSTVDNKKRQVYRVELMKWANQVPNEFYKLFLKFSSVNDPQIRSDIFSILMSLLFENENTGLLTSATKWLMENVLAPDKIEENRDIAIRYYSTSVVRKAVSLHMIDPEIASKCLPPYTPKSNSIALSQEALAGTYMSGYGGITYDLGRYVLTDHIMGVLPDDGMETEKQYEKLIESIAENQTEFVGISSHQLILSAAYEFITMCGWNEEFCYHEVDGRKIYDGVDWAISNSYWPETHGSQSPVMTICEKYVWQARNYISGFLADRLMHVDDEGAAYIDDYSLIDNFLIPALEIGEIDPDGVKDLYPWYIPEKNAVIISGKSNSSDDVKHAVQTSPDITWKEWIQIDNTERQYPIEVNELIALSGYSCFEGSAGVKTNLWLKAIMVSTNDVDEFIEGLSKKTRASYRSLNPFDWEGSCSVHCYVTPKEICWMPWKKRYDSGNIDDFPGLKIHSAVDECIYNFIGHGDVFYELPSAPIREILNITNTNGYLFYDCNKKVKAASILVGEKWGTRQNYLLVDKSLLQDIDKRGITLLWIMREERQESIKAKERFGDFYAEKDYRYVGFFKDKEFVTIRISPDEDQSSDIDDTDDSYSNILEKYGYRTGTSEYTE